jgi:surface carbohydrate biosynthesis protein (TIGR04326 family)
VNSETAKKHLNDFGYPNQEVEIVEALRYLYLTDLYKKKNFRQIFQNIGKPTLLLLGDYDWKNSELLLETVSLCDLDLLKKFTIIYKYHPGSEKSGYFNFDKYNIEIASENLSNLLQKVDIICTTNSTSSAVEAVTANLPVLSMLNPDVLNMSPLKDLSVVKFFKDYRELLIELESFLNGAETEREPVIRQFDYFCLDRKLPRWKRLLDVQEVNYKDNK